MFIWWIKSSAVNASSTAIYINLWLTLMESFLCKSQASKLINYSPRRLRLAFCTHFNHSRNEQKIVSEQSWNSGWLVVRVACDSWWMCEQIYGSWMHGDYGLPNEFFDSFSRDTLFFQGLILSLMAQLTWSLVADTHAPRSPSAASASNPGIIGTLQRSAAIKATPEQETSLAQSARGQRCVRCGTSGYYGGNNAGYADRWGLNPPSETPFKSIRRHIRIVCESQFIKTWPKCQIKFYSNSENVNETNWWIFSGFRMNIFCAQIQILRRLLL